MRVCSDLCHPAIIIPPVTVLLSEILHGVNDKDPRHRHCKRIVYLEVSFQVQRTTEIPIALFAVVSRSFGSALYTDHRLRARRKI